MTISEMIACLRELQEQHGDIGVFVQEPGTDLAELAYVDVASIRVVKPSFKVWAEYDTYYEEKYPNSPVSPAVRIRTL